MIEIEEHNGSNTIALTWVIDWDFYKNWQLLMTFA